MDGGGFLGVNGNIHGGISMLVIGHRDWWAWPTTNHGAQLFKKHCVWYYFFLVGDFLCARCARSDPATLFSFLVLFLLRRMSDAFEASFLLVVIVFSFRVVAWSVGKQYMQ